MTCFKVCALVVLAVAVIGTTASPHHKGPMSEAFHATVKKCAAEHNVSDVKTALHSPSAEYGCFYKCLKDEAGDSIKNGDSPMANDLAACEASVPTTSDPCADAFELKKCMKQKFMEAHPNFKEE